MSRAVVNPPVAAIRQTGIVPRLINLLKRDDNRPLQVCLHVLPLGCACMRFVWVCVLCVHEGARDQDIYKRHDTAGRACANFFQ